MNQDIIKYLQDNKEQYSQEELTEKMKEDGYDKHDIEQGIKEVYICSNPLNKDFWNFSSKKTYCQSSEKAKDFLFGFLGPIAPLLLLIIPILGPLVYFGFYFYTLFYFFGKRKWIAYGIFSNLMVGVASFVIFIWFLVNNRPAVEAILEKFL